MEIKKIAGILIIVFLGLSVLFYSLYQKETANKMVLSEDFVEGAVLNINNSGIDISEDVIDRDIPEMDIFVFDVENMNDHNDRITDALIKCLYSGNAVKASFDTPDGVSVGIYEKDNEAQEIGRVVYSYSDFSFAFSRQGTSINGSQSPVTNGLLDLTEKQMSTIDSLFAELLSDVDSNYRISGTSSNDEYSVITVVQEIGGYDVHNVFVNFIFDGEEVIALSGKWIIEDAAPKYNNKLLDGVNVLYKLDFENVGSIRDEGLVYLLRKSDGGRYFLIPGWEITYVDKEGRLEKAYFDGL